MKNDTPPPGGPLPRVSVLALVSALAIMPVALILLRQAFAQDRPYLADAQRLCKDLAPDD